MYMKRILLIIALIIGVVSGVFAGSVKVLMLKGTASIRHGVDEKWNPVTVGDLLKPEDTIELGKQSSAVLLVDGSKKLSLPENVIIDMADLRVLSQEEVLLKLAMEAVRAVPKRENIYQTDIPRMTTVHGSNMEKNSSIINVSREMGLKQLNGTKVLYENGYFGTCILRTKDVTRQFPALPRAIDARLRAASALERMNLRLEALEEYNRIGNEELTPDQHSLVALKMSELREQKSK
jgi:hypothetical protein